MTSLIFLNRHCRRSSRRWVEVSLAFSSFLFLSRGIEQAQVLGLKGISRHTDVCRLDPRGRQRDEDGEPGGIWCDRPLRASIQHPLTNPCSRIVFHQTTSPDIRKPRRPCSCRSRFDVSAQKLVSKPSPHSPSGLLSFVPVIGTGGNRTGNSVADKVRQCIVIQSRAARSASASSALVMLRARSARSEAALSDPRIAAMLSHLWAATRSTLHPRPVA